MAIINYSPWSDAANYGQGLGSSLTNLLIQLPQIRQQQALLAAHQQLYGAQAGLYGAEAERARAQVGTYGAEADLYKAKAGEITSAEAAKERLGNALRQIPTTLALGGSIDPLVSDVVDNLARLPHADRAGLGESLAQMLEMSKPRFRTALGLGSKMMEHVPAGSTAYNVVSGQPEYQAPQTVGPGATLFDPSTGQPVYQSPRTLGYGQNLVAPESGETLAVGRDRPLSDAIHSGVFGAAARGYFDPIATEAKKAAILQSIVPFLQALPGGGMPTNALPIVPGRGAATRNPRFNPTTNRVERYNPVTKQWE